MVELTLRNGRDSHLSKRDIFLFDRQVTCFEGGQADDVDLVDYH